MNRCKTAVKSTIHYIIAVNYNITYIKWLKFNYKNSKMPVFYNINNISGFYDMKTL